MGIYSTGTINVSSGGTAVTGTGTAWVTVGLRAGDLFTANGLTRPIASVNSNTSITLAQSWPGATISGGVYFAQLIDDDARSLVALNTLRDQLTNGNLTALSGLAGAANRLPYFSGAGAFALADLSAFARSLLDDANAAAFWATLGASSAPAQAFRRGNILAEVSQSGGVPTGGVIERGSNANGEYVRFADGTQICTRDVFSTDGITTADGTLFVSSTDLTWTYPAAFASSPSVGGDLIRQDRIGGVAVRTRSATVAGYRPWVSASLPSGPQVVHQLRAIGRWF